MTAGRRGARAARGALAALIGLVGCGCAVPDAPRSVVTVWAMGQEGAAAKRMLPAFERSHRGVRVRVQQVPWSAAHEKLLTAFVGDALPDVVQVGSTWVPELVTLGALAPVAEGRGGRDRLDRADWFAGVWDAYTIRGRAYALPWYVDTRVLFYRSDLLAAAGVETPPVTWRGWRRALRRVAAAPGRYGLFAPPTDWWLPVTLAMQRGATLVDAAGRSHFDAPAVRRAVAFYVSLFRDGLAPVSGGADVANVYQDFAAGYFAVYPSGPWDLGEFARRLPPVLAGRWHTAPMPGWTPPGPGASIVGGAGLAVTARARDPAMAWAVAHYLTSGARQLDLHRLTGDLPARRSAWARGRLATDPRVATFRRQLEHVITVPPLPEWERIVETFGRHVDRAVRGDTSVGDALAAVERDVDAILAKRRWLVARGRVP